MDWENTFLHWHALQGSCLLHKHTMHFAGEIFEESSRIRHKTFVLDLLYPVPAVQLWLAITGIVLHP